MALRGAGGMGGEIGAGLGATAFLAGERAGGDHPADEGGVGLGGFVGGECRELFDGGGEAGIVAQYADVLFHDGADWFGGLRSGSGFD